MSHHENIKNLKEKAKGAGISELGLYLIQLMNSIKVEVVDLIYVRTRQIVVTSAYHTTVGGNVVEEIEVQKSCGKKKIMVTMVEQGATPVTIVSAKCEIGKIKITFSADPGNDHKISYLLIE